MTKREEKVANLIRELSAVFLERESNLTSLVTVTSASVSGNLKTATVFISVLPEEKEDEALAFAKRKRGELRNYLKENIKTKNIPFLDIVLDRGEKNRQKIDELLRKK